MKNLTAGLPPNSDNVGLKLKRAVQKVDFLAWIFLMAARTRIELVFPG